MRAYSGPSRVSALLLCRLKSECLVLLSGGFFFLGNMWSIELINDEKGGATKKKKEVSMSAEENDARGCFSAAKILGKI